MHPKISEDFEKSYLKNLMSPHDGSASPIRSPKIRIDVASESVCVKSIRCLAADMVQAANSGHPGAPMGCAAVAHALFGHVMNFNPENPSWWGRDRFVLSNGHACALLYSMLHLTGYKAMTLDQLRNFRQINSITPGHPEAGVTPGVEVSTGPLGQGISNAVGLAIAQEILAAEYTPDLFNNFTYVVCGDGCLQEGVSYEACSLAGHLGLGRLIVLYDDNNITIDGSTELSFTEDVRRRFEAQNWEVLEVEDGNNDIAAIVAAVNQAKLNLDQPTLIKVKTTIGIDSSKQGSEKSHGSPLGAEDIKRIKELYGFDPLQSFHVSQEVYDFYKAHSVARGQAMEMEWNEKLSKFAASHPEKAAELSERFAGKLPLNWESTLPKFDEKPKATRQYSGEVLAAAVKAIRSIVGGSADLTESTVTNKANLAAFSKKERGNRFIHFGVREHAMAAISNGLSAYGGFLPFCATFANFIGYAWGAARLSALSHHKVLYVATHDSIDLGEDGPTHQPIEILGLLRGTPNMQTIRPADGNETIGAYKAHLIESNKGPTTIVLSRGAVNPLAGSSAEGVLHGAYILSDFGQDVQSQTKIILAGSGTEVQLLVEAKKILAEKHGTSCRVVSVPSVDMFQKQPEEYKKSVFPADSRVLFVEASSCLGAESFAHSVVGMTTFGASAPAKVLKQHFGFTVENIVSKAMAL
jgi:transketolase